MSTAWNGDVEIYDEEFPANGSRRDFFLVNGLGHSASTTTCRGASSSARRASTPPSATTTATSASDEARRLRLRGSLTWRTDAIAVLDAMGVEKAHVMGCSWGHDRAAARSGPHRPLALLDVGHVADREPGYGDSPRGGAGLSARAPPAPSRAAYIYRQVAAHHVYGSKPEWLDDDAIRVVARRR